MTNQESLERNINRFIEQKLDGFAEILADFLATPPKEQIQERQAWYNVFSFGKKSTNPDINNYKENIKPELSNFVAAFVKEFHYRGIPEPESQEDYVTYQALKNAKNNAENALIEKCREVFPETFVNMQPTNFSNVIVFEWGKFREDLLEQKNKEIDALLKVYLKDMDTSNPSYILAQTSIQMNVMTELGFSNEGIYPIVQKRFDDTKKELYWNNNLPPERFLITALAAWDLWNFYKQEKSGEIQAAAPSEELIEQSQEWVKKARLVSKTSDVLEKNHLRNKELSHTLRHADDLRRKETVAEENLLQIFSEAGIARDATLLKLREIFFSREI